jgi:hypothetical protein
MIDEIIKMFDYAYHRDEKAENISTLFHYTHNAGCYGFDGKYRLYDSTEFLTDRQEFLDIQNGKKPIRKTVERKGFLVTNRDLASVAHKDLPYHWLENFYFGILAKGIKPKAHVKGFITGGPVGLFPIVLECIQNAMEQTRAWKYEYLRIRPEELAGLLEF